MKAIYLNKYEYYEPDHRTRKAYRKLIHLRNQLIFNQISLIEFIGAVERVLFNDVPIKDFKHFSNKNPYFNVLSELINSTESDAAAYRLKTDLLTVY